MTEIDERDPRSSLANLCSPFGNVLEVHVGPEPATRFVVHEELVKSTSSFFQKALTNGWKEAQERCVKLPLQEPQHFHVYVHWLYSRMVATPEDNTLADLYRAKMFILGDILQDDQFKDAVLDALAFYNDGLRALVVDIALQCDRSGEKWAQWVEGHSKLDDLPAEFIHAIAQALYGGGENTEVLLLALRGKFPEMCVTKDLCRYHHHDVADECPWKKSRFRADGSAMEE
ncbi:hypothetical protein EJ08DRAFT_699467 [Tothia fuscella]|uniref:BTB domain-containing protein n=1 Tax=Tothia fuscella TaxID=1048955 RepID=A0A9P4TW79_9PEZI|nr:hypothetical protein EJ08DRAFT_699467 [Tothia fuscella]